MAISRLLVAVALFPPQGTPVGKNVDLTGRPDAAISESFSLITWVRELPGNRAVITDQLERVIRVADFATNSVRQAGRQGDGPGEYRFPMAPLAASGDSTWVYDFTLRRAHLVSPEGRITRSVTVPTSGVPAGLLGPRGVDGRGRVYFEANSFDRERGSFTDSVAVVRWDPADNSTEVLTRVWSGGRVVLDRPGGGASFARSATPFPHLDAWGVLPGGEIVIVKHDPLRIDVVADGGKVTQGTPMPYTPIAVTAAERRAYRERHGARRTSAATISGGGQSRRGPEFLDNEFPRFMPPFIATAVMVSPEGEVWIGRSHAGGDATWRYDIFSARGAPIGRATIRRNSSVVGFGAGTVYVARTDPSDDLVYLERYRR